MKYLLDLMDLYGYAGCDHVDLPKSCNTSETKKGDPVVWKRKHGTGVLFALVVAVVLAVGLMMGAASPALATLP